MIDFLGLRRLWQRFGCLFFRFHRGSKGRRDTRFVVVSELKLPELTAPAGGRKLVCRQASVGIPSRLQGLVKLKAGQTDQGAKYEEIAG